MGFLDRFRKKKSVEPAYDTKDRYQLEHMILRQWILGENGAAVLSSVIEQKGDFFAGLFQAMHKDEAHYTCPYSPDDFKVQGVRLARENQEKLVLQIQMPRPERVTLCSSVYIVHDDRLENRRYITTELSHSGGLIICEWTKDGGHVNYGTYSEKALRNIILSA